MLSGPACTDHDMRVNDVGRPARREHPSDARGIYTVEDDHVGRRLPEKTGETYLPRRGADDLSECSRRHGDAGSGFACSGEQRGCAGPAYYPTRDNSTITARSTSATWAGSRIRDPDESST